MRKSSRLLLEADRRRLESLWKPPLADLPRCRSRLRHAPRTTGAVESRAITSAILGLASTLSRLSASLRPRSGLPALTGTSVEPDGGIYVMPRQITRAIHESHGRELQGKE